MSRKNSEERNKYLRDWRHANPDKRRAADQRYVLKHGRLPRRNTPKKWAVATVSDIKRRAQKQGLAFDLTAEWLLSIVPPICPIFLTPFVFGRLSPQNASVDQLLPGDGYTRTNVRVISLEANLLKRRCTDPAVFRRLADWVEQELQVLPLQRAA